MLLLVPLFNSAQAQTPALEVENSSGATLFQVNTDGSVQLVPQAAAAGFVLTATDASGNASWQAGPGLALPFSGSYDLLPPAFSLSKTGPGELLSLSKTGPGQALFITSGGGAVGDFAARINGSFGGITTQAGNGFGLNVTNTSASATIRTANSGSGAAARFEGDVEVTGGLACTGCIDGTDVAVNSIEGIRVMDGTLSGADVGDGSLTGADVQNGSLTASDVDATSGFYVSKSQLYVEDKIFSVSNGGTGFSGDVLCRDVNDLPLSGGCVVPPSGDIFVRYAFPKNWTSTTEPAEYSCVVTNLSTSTIQGTARIVCLDVN